MKPEHLCLMPRYAELARLRAYFEGTQYAGRADFWTGTSPKGGPPVPLRERAPCIKYPLAKAAVQQVVRFTFGEGKFPTLRVEEQKDEGAFGDLKLSADEAKLLETGVTDLIENARLRSVMRALMARGLAERTAVAIVSIKNGRFSFDLPHAQDCLPTFRNDDPDDELLALTWVYQYDETVVELGVARQEKFWFRQDVTATDYVLYEKTKVIAGEHEVRWVQKSRTPHGFGFAPVLWIRNLSDLSSEAGQDGFSLYEDLFSEFDALNFALSQRHRGITFFGAPQPWESGVEDDDGPEADGRRAGPTFVPTSGRGGYAEVVKAGTAGAAPAGRVAGAPAGTMRERVRRMAPDQMWTYRNAQARVGLIETTGVAFDVATKHVEDVRQRALETMSVVLASIEAFTKGGGEMNAKFLVLAFAPLLNLVSELRDATWWPFGLQAVISLCLRIVSVRKGDGILMPNVVKLSALLERFDVEVEAADVGPSANDDETTEGPRQGTKIWMLPKITPVWGDAFEPSNAEVSETVTSAAGALTAGLIQKKTAAQYVAPHFGVDDVDEEIKAIDEAKEADATVEHERQLDLQSAKQPPKPTDGPKGPKT